MGSESDRSAGYSGQATAGSDETAYGNDGRQKEAADHLATHFSERELQRLEELTDREHLNCVWVIERLLADRPD